MKAIIKGFAVLYIVSDAATVSGATVTDGTSSFTMSEFQEGGVAILAALPTAPSDAPVLAFTYDGTGVTYQADLYAAWKLRTNPVPATVSMAQARIALSRQSLFTTVDNLITSIGGETKIWWDYATIVERANPLVAQLGAALAPPLTSDQIDDLFRLAATITA